jgi:hypothetical protein
VRRVVGFVGVAVRELWSLVVDDGFLALAALGAVGVAFLASRDALLGPSNAVGWLLVGLVVASLVVSVGRAVARESAMAPRPAARSRLGSDP